MPNYKDLANKLHFLDDANNAYLLPIGCMLITEAEADLISNPPLTNAQKIGKENVDIKAKIEDMEADSFRAIREAILTNDKVALLAIEAEIVKERAKLK